MIRILSFAMRAILFPFRLLRHLAWWRRDRAGKDMAKKTNTVGRNIFKVILFFLVVFLVGYIVWTWIQMRG